MLSCFVTVVKCDCVINTWMNGLTYYLEILLHNVTSHTALHSTVIKKNNSRYMYLSNCQTNNCQDERQTPCHQVKVTFTTLNDITLWVICAKSEMPCVGQYSKPDRASNREVVYDNKYHCAWCRLTRTPSTQHLHIYYSSSFNRSVQCQWVWSSIWIPPC